MVEREKESKFIVENFLCVFNLIWVVFNLIWIIFNLIHIIWIKLFVQPTPCLFYRTFLTRYYKFVRATVRLYNEKSWIEDD